MTQKHCLGLVKGLFQSKENASKSNYFTAPAYRISCFKNMQPCYKPDMKDIKGINIVLN